MANTVKQCLNESLVQILTPKRRVDILRDVLDAQRSQKPYVITFCGVNGVGKSTNLAKVRLPRGSAPSCLLYVNYMYMLHLLLREMCGKLLCRNRLFIACAIAKYGN